jgi:hypothetical protein
MPTPTDPSLYAHVKKRADQIYAVPSAYKSGWIVRTYKSLGGEYADDARPRTLRRWFREKWTDIGRQSYPVYRPTRRISKATPLTVSEIDPVQAARQIKLKQRLRHMQLPPFQSRFSYKVAQAFK